MADEQVGTVSVRVIPDTKGFRAKLKAELEKIERALELEIEVGLRLSRKDLLQARREIKALDKGAKVNVKLELDKSALAREVRRVIDDANKTARENPIEPEVKPAPWDIREFTRSIRQSIDQALAEVDEIEIPAELEDAELRADLARLIEEAERMAEVEVDLDMDDTDFRRAYQDLRNEINETVSKIKIDADVKNAEAQLESFLQQMRDKSIVLPVELDGTTEAALQAEELARDRELNITAVLNAARAASQIAVLTHSRTLDIRAHLRGSSVGQIAGLLAGLAGFRLLTDISRDVRDFVTQIDRATPRIGAMTVAIAGISAAGLGALGAVTQLGVGLGHLMRGMLLVPAAAAGLATSFFILKRAFKDAGTYIGDLAPQYEALGNAISAGYWSVAADSIRIFTASMMPLANVWLPRIAEELGWVTDSIAAAFAGDWGRGKMESFFRNTVRGLQESKEGFGLLTQALLDLVEAGSRQFPALGRWFEDTMRTFRDWTNRVTSDGSFDRWMEKAGRAARDFGSIMVSTGRIMGAFAEATRRAGSPTLSDMADGLERVADAANSARGLEFLTTMFRGANNSIRNMIPGLKDLGNAFVDLAPQMASVMEITGDIVSTLASGLSDVLNNDTFKTGLVSMFESFRRSAELIKPVFDTLGTDFGMLMETVGIVAEQLSRVLAVAAEEVSNLFQDLLRIVQAITPVLGDWLVGALRVLGPAISFVSDIIADFVERFPGLSAAIFVAAAAFGLLVTAVGLVARPLVAAASGFFALKRALPDLAGPLAKAAGSFGGIGTALGNILRVGGRFLGWVALAIFAFQQMWENSENLRDAFGKLWEALKELGRELWEAVGPAFERISQESLPGLIEAFGSLMDALDPVFGMLGDLAALIVEDLAYAIERLTPLLSGIAGGLATALGGALEGLGSVLETWASVFQGDWETAWQHMNDAAEEILGGLGEGIYRVLEGFAGSAASALDQIAPGWREDWAQFGLDALDALAESLGMDNAGELITAAQAVGNLVVDEARAAMEGESGGEGGAGGMFAVGQGLIASLVAGIYADIENVKTAARTTVNSFIVGFVAEIATLPSRVKAHFDALMVTMWASLLAGLTNLLATVIVWVVQLVSTFAVLPTQILAVIESLPTLLRVQVGLWFAQMVVGVQQGIARLGAAFGRMWAVISGAIAAIPGLLRAQVVLWFAGMVASAAVGVGQLVLQFSMLWGRIQAVIAAIPGLLRAQVVLWFVGMVAAVVTGIGRIITNMQTLGVRMIAALASIPGQMRNMGMNMMLGLIAGIISMAHRVAEAARSVVQRAVDKAKEVLNINSPSRVFMEIGEYTGDGFVIGLEHRTAAAQDAMRRMVRPPSPVDPSMRAAALAGGDGGINVTVQSRDGEDPTRIGRRAGEAIAFELGKEL